MMFFIYNNLQIFSDEVRKTGVPTGRSTDTTSLLQSIFVTMRSSGTIFQQILIYSTATGGSIFGQGTRHTLRTLFSLIFINELFMTM